MLPDHPALSLYLLLGLWLVLPLLSSERSCWRAAVLLPLIPIQLFYFYWRYSETIEPLELSPDVLWQYLFFSTESMVIVYSLWQCITLVRFTNRTAECDRLVEISSAKCSESVDLYIPTYSESPAILKETIAAAKKVNHSNVTLWICDDGNRQWLRKLCELENVRYLSRPVTDPIRTKAANLRWSIPHGSANYIVCIDADFQLDPDCVTRLTSFFENPEIGLVQAPQHFRNLDPVQRNLLGGAAWTEEQRFFFDVSLASRDAWGNTLCVGSCWASRRSLIDEMGGFPQNSIVEDVYFGYRIKSLGYRLVYLNEKLATGLAAEDTPSYVVQRTRWCLGALTLLSDPHGPLRTKQLSLSDRLFYLEIPFYWITHLHLMLLLLAPSVYGLFGYNVFNCTTEELFTIVIPKNILLCAAFYWVSNGCCMPLITPVHKTISIFHTVPAIFRGAFYPKGARFEVTRKDISHSGRTFHWKLAAPFIAIGVLTVVATAKTFTQNYSAFYWSDYSAYNALLSTYSLITIFLCCLVCVDKPLRHDELRNTIPLTGSWSKTAIVLSKRIFA